MNPNPSLPPFARLTALVSRSRSLIAAAFVILNSSFVMAQQQPDPAAHTVIIPYTGSPLHQTPTRFYLGYDEFQRLWSLAKENRKPAVTKAEDTALVIHQSLYDATIEERGLVINARITAVTRGHWSKLALPFIRIENGKDRDGALVGEVNVNGKAAALTDGYITLENPGTHSIALTATLPLPPSWTSLKLRLPSAMAGVLALHTPKSDGWPRINDTAALTVEEKPDARLFTHALGLHSELQLTRTTRGLDRGEGPVPAARVEATLSLQDMQLPTLDATLHYDFPGATRRTLSFSIDPEQVNLDFIKVTSGDKHVPMDRIETELEPKRVVFKLHLRHEISGSARIELSGFGISLGVPLGVPPSGGRAPAGTQATAPANNASPAKAGTPNGTPSTFRAPLPEAVRITQKLTLQHDAATQLTPQPDANQQRIAADALTFQSNGTAPLRFLIKATPQFESADANYVFQLSEQKAELLAALALKRKRGLWTRAEIGLPDGYDVQIVQGPAVIAWQHEGRSVYVHFNPQIAGQEARIVVHLVRTLAQPATTWQLTPLTLSGYEKLTGRALIVAHAATDVKLPDFAQRSDIKELDATALDSVFAIAPPLEKKRALKLEGGTWSTQVTLARQPARFAADAIALVLASDAGIRLSQQLAIHVEQGALRQISLRLPAALPEAVVTGPLLREMRTRIENNERIYDCSFQTDVLDQAALTFDLDLPISATLDVPFVKLPDAGRLTRWFVLDNASAREATITTQTALEAVTRDALPYLPAGLSRPQFFRATQDGTLTLAYQQLTSTEGNAALITLADLTTILRADGQRWDIAQYSLINRSLQFLPVILPQGAELITVSVSGQPVRADEETQNGKRTRLIPLIHTKPGQRALEVKLIYRFAKSDLNNSKLDDPELPGLSVERTTWTVWTPNGHQLANHDGNMEEVGKEGRELQQLEGMLSELGEANRTLARGDLDGDSAKQAYDQAKELTQKVRDKKQETLSSIVSNGLTRLMSGRYEQKSLSDFAGGGEYMANPQTDQMDYEVAQQGKLLEDNYKRYAGKDAQQNLGKSKADANTTWNSNKTGDGTLKLQGANTFSGGVAVNGGQLFNDNVAVDNTYFANQGTTRIGISGPVAGKPDTEIRREVNVAPGSANLPPQIPQGTGNMDLGSASTLTVNGGVNSTGINQGITIGSLTSGWRAGSVTINNTAVDDALITSVPNVVAQTNGDAPLTPQLNISSGGQLDISGRELSAIAGSGISSTSGNTYAGANITTFGSAGSPPPAPQVQLSGGSLSFSNSASLTKSGGGTLVLSGNTAAGGINTPQMTQQGQLNINGSTINSNARGNNLSQVDAPAERDGRTQSGMQIAAGAPIKASSGGRANYAAADPFSSTPMPASQPAVAALKAEPISDERQPAAKPASAAPIQQSAIQNPQFLKPTGRHALEIALPTEGVAHHFSKLKDHAVLEITLKSLSKPQTTSRAIYLTLGLLACFGAWRWSTKRQARPA